ncbi:MAG: LamG domain-containing protein, partial [Gammaproteobacteria bacterium]|nr:LamG domain-containing protein [Gammaproteobacteria bacterium]
TINVTNMFGIDFENKGGKGAVYVNSGTLNLAEFSATQSLRGPADSAFIDISEGSVVITGDLSGAVNDYIASGNITAYGGTGTVVVEVVEGNTVVTAVDGVLITFGNELIFDGLNDYVDVGNGDPMNISGSELTLEAWIYATEWRAAKHEGCIINTESSGPNNGYMIRAGANGTLNFNVGNDGWNEINTAEGALSLNTWHHIAATFNAGVQTLYIDGVLAVTADNSASTTTVGVATTNTFIGSSQSNDDRSFRGTIHDARIWNVARTVEEIAANKDIELSGSEEGLAGYWQLNEGIGNQVVADLTGNQDGQLGSTDGQDENDPRWLGEIIIPALDVQPKDFLVFDGTSQYVDLGNPAALDITGSAITIEALINMKEWRDEV